MNTLKKEKQRQVVAALVEGNSIRATCRMTGVAKNTVVKLLVALGKACAEYQDKVLRNLTCKKIQCDEIWAFCYAKEKNVPEDKKGQFGYGDVWTFTALDADTKLISSWSIGRRDADCATEFLKDLAARLKNRVQLTTDGHKMYLEAVESAFGSEIDFSQLIKIYGNTEESQKRYSPAQCIGTEKIKINGSPKDESISTSYVERQNLSMRMNMRRFTRLTNGFSKKVENLFYAEALYFMYYNFCRIHQTLRITPAMAAKVTDRLWEIDDIIALLK
ncbi:MAG TPA: IS1 family transposase [Thermodesulfobacteriota bacterium]|nr:IS1 family transposase [Thermodesulfobacteriota bacterium]